MSDVASRLLRPHLSCAQRAFPWLCIAVLALITGCASGPSIPQGLDLSRASIQALEAEPQVKLEEEGWTSRASRTGGMTGAGVGLGIGGLACAATGPLAPLCFASVVPLTAAVGAVGGAVVGKVVATSGEGVADKSALLRREWGSLARRLPLPQAVEGELRLASRAADGASAPQAWRLQVGYATLGTLGSGADKPFALQGTARLQVWQAGRSAPEVDLLYSASSTARLSLEQWRAKDGRALREALDTIGRSLASQVAADLAGAARRGP